MSQGDLGPGSGGGGVGESVSFEGAKSNKNSLRPIFYQL